MATPTMDIKEDADHLEIQQDPRYDLRYLSREDAEFLSSFPEAAKKKVMWKIDIRLMPLLTILYLVSYIDRANLGNAKIEGLDDDLKLDGVKYNIASCLFFVPYVLLEIPINYTLSKAKRPSFFLGAMIVAWGIVMTLMGIVQNFAGLVAARVVLGITESGFFPGAIYLVSAWYLPNESQTRIAIFYCASAGAGAVSGLLAFAIAKMDGIAGLGGWRWIFIIEGIFSVLAGIVAFWIMPDTPRLSGHFLSNDEIRFLELRQLATPGRRHHGQSEEVEKPFQWRDLWAVLGDWQIYMLAIIYLSSTAPNYALKFTMPQIIKNMGYTSSMAQVLTIPPYTIGIVASIGTAWIADRFTWRMPFVIVADLCILVAHAILYCYGPTQADHIPECYFALCLACIGLYPIPPGVNAWLISNTAPQTRRAMAIAYFVGLGNLGGIFGSFVYLESEAPRYPTGYATAFSLASAGVVSALLLEFVYTRINKKRDTLDEDEVRRTHPEEQLEKMGDRSPLFRYSL